MPLTPGNHILDGLNPEETAVLGPDLREVSVKQGAVLSEAGQPARYLYFPIDCVLAFLSRHIAQFKLPAFVWFAEEPLPKLGTGKIDKVELRERYRRELSAPA